MLFELLPVSTAIVYQEHSGRRPDHQGALGEGGGRHPHLLSPVLHELADVVVALHHQHQEGLHHLIGDSSVHQHHFVQS